MTDSSTLMLLLRMGFSLLLILAMIAGTARLLRRRGRVGGGPGDPTTIDVIARRSVGRRSNLLVIRIGERELLVGTSDTSVRLVADLNAPVPVAEPTSAETTTDITTPTEVFVLPDISELGVNLDASHPNGAMAEGTPRLLGAIRDLTVRRS